MQFPTREMLFACKTILNSSECTTGWPLDWWNRSLHFLNWKNWINIRRPVLCSKKFWNRGGQSRRYHCIRNNGHQVWKTINDHLKEIIYLNVLCRRKLTIFVINKIFRQLNITRKPYRSICKYIKLRKSKKILKWQDEHLNYSNLINFLKNFWYCMFPVRK